MQLDYSSDEMMKSIYEMMKSIYEPQKPKYEVVIEPVRKPTKSPYEPVRLIEVTKPIQSNRSVQEVVVNAV